MGNSQSEDNKRPSLAFVEGLKRQWMAMIDALVDPVIFVRHDGTIDKANKAMAKWAKRDIKEIVGQSSIEVFSSMGAPCPLTMVGKENNASTNKQVSTYQTKNRRFFEVTAHPHHGDDNKQLGYVFVYRDQTEAHQLQEQLVQSEKLASIGLLAGGIAHEINNPLGGILVFSQMILREMPQDNPHYPDVEEILNATQRCKAIVENLLEFARTRSDQLPTHMAEDVNVDDAINTALRFIKIGMPTDSIDVNIDLNTRDHVIEGDRNRLIQVFLNLMQNAVQAMPDGGTLEIITSYDNAKISCLIKDSGIGIGAEQLKRIFDPFFTTKDPGEGTGLGLAICYGIVQDLKGSIHVESQVNQGTTFTIKLPRKLAVEKSA